MVKHTDIQYEKGHICQMKKPTIFKPVIREKTQMPKFIIVGVMKCGTRKWFQMISSVKSDRWNPTSGLNFVEIISSAISRFLQEHPLLYDMGETYFFNRHYARGYVSISNVENWKKIFIHRIKKNHKCQSINQVYRPSTKLLRTQAQTTPYSDSVRTNSDY